MLPVWPMIDEMLMIRPVPRSSMCWSAAFERWNAPDRLTSSTFCQSSSDILKTVLSLVMPALFTRMSSRPWRSRTSLTVRRQSSAEALLDRPPALAGGADVALVRRRLDVRLREVRAQALRGLRVAAVAGGDVRALHRERTADRRPDAAGPSRDEGNAALELVADACDL